MSCDPKIANGRKWEIAEKDKVSKCLNPQNHLNGAFIYQFADLSAPTGISEEEVRDFLKDKGVLAGMEKVYLEAAKKYNISEVYLVAHSALETGNGTSELAVGYEVEGVIVYNMYGIGAIDGDAVVSGAQYAYDRGWDTPEKAIAGGAEWISKNYINSENYHQNTLYEMRWNPDCPGTHQYATDVNWAIAQVSSIKRMYDEFPDARIVFRIPVYKEN